MPNGLTLRGTCHSSCGYKASYGCFHSEYAKAAREKRKCPLDPRTTVQINQDVWDRRTYYTNLKLIEEIKAGLKVYQLPEAERKKKIKEFQAKIQELETQNVKIKEKME